MYLNLLFKLKDSKKGGEKMEYYMNVKDVCKILGRKESYSYALIKKMNEELKEKGYITVRGKVPRKYFYERLGLEEEE